MARLRQIAAPATTPGRGAEGGAIFVTAGHIIAATAEIKVPHGGTITEVRVKEGQQVKAGAILFRLDQSEMEARVRIDRTRVELALTKFDTAQRSGATSDAELRAAQADLRTERENLNSDQAMFEANAFIRAPIDGTLTTCDVSPNTFVPPGTTLTTVVNTTDLKVDFNISTVVNLQLGQKVTVKAAGKEYACEISYIAPSVQAQTLAAEGGMRQVNGRYEPLPGEAVNVRGKVVGDPGVLKAGMRVDVFVADQ